MNKKFIWLIVSCLMVAALVLASCGPVAVEEKAVKEGPQYGGTLTVLMSASGGTGDPANPDMALGHFNPTQWLSPIQEKPLVGDFEKYGPRGTGEFAFQLAAYIPDKFMKGQLLKSWELSPDKTVWHIRPGIMWQPGYSGIMEARELTAEDIAADLIYFRDGAAGGWSFRGMSGDIYAEDKYTLVIETPGGFDLTLMYVVGLEDRSLVSPPEMIDAGADKWANQVGTGPFMLKEYVVGSHMSYERNPDYWDTTTINGKEYQIPFIDKMIWPIIPDPSTQIAAIQTGMVDYFNLVESIHWPALDKTAGLLSAKYLGPGVRAVGVKVDRPPFSDIEVRRAMMIGTDMKAFADLEGVGTLPLHSFPLYVEDPTVYTPLKELPAETQLLYEYNPTLAKQMLADAGFPDGFKINCYIESSPTYIDRASLLEDMWAKIGVEVEIKGIDPASFYGEMYKREPHVDSWMGTYEQGNPIPGLIRKAKTGELYNWGMWSNERFDELTDKMVAELDAAERYRLIKEAGLLLLNEVIYVPLSPFMGGHYWWPWIKNYYGECNVQDNMDISAILARVWFDQDLKAKMGY